MKVFGTSIPLLLFLFLCSNAIASQSGIQCQVREDGFITSWLILGPFTNSAPGSQPTEDHGPGCFAYHNDLLQNAGGEATILPVAGQTVQSIVNEQQTWRPYFSHSWWINFNNIFTPNENVAAYAFSILHMEESGRVTFGLSHNDGMKLWLNGTLLYKEHYVKLSPNAVTLQADLKKGNNYVMIKIDEKSGGWGFGLSVQAAQEQKANIPTIILPLDNTGTDLETLVFDNLTLINSEPVTGEPLCLNFPNVITKLPRPFKLPLVVLTDKNETLTTKTLAIKAVPENRYPIDLKLTPANYTLALQGQKNKYNKKISCVKQKVFNTDPDTRIGSRPYEMGTRPGNKNPQIDFEDLSHWWIHSQNSCSVKLYRSRSEQMDGEFVAKTVYKGKKSYSSFEFGPAHPVPINDNTDVVNIWICGNNWEWIPDPTTPQVEVQIVLIDENGREQSISLGKINWKGWFLRRVAFPLAYKNSSFKSIRVSGCGNTEDRLLCFDSIQFSHEERKSLAIKPLPDMLPFLTTPETILPVPATLVSVQSGLKDKTYFSIHLQNGKKTVFHYTPKTGTLSDFSVKGPAGDILIPFQTGDIEFLLPADGNNPKRTLLDVKQDKESIIYEWLFSKGKISIPYQITIRSKHNSLLIDVIVKESELATGLQFGYLKSETESKLVRVPMLTYDLPDPQVVCCGDLFVLALLDHYRSHASTLYARNELISSNQVRFNGGCLYKPKTDGHRNPLKERIVLTVSSNFQDVLPTIPHPPSSMGHLTKSRCWRQHWGMPPDTTAHEKFYRHLKTLHDYGVSRFIVRHHEETWRDDAESFTLRLQAAPAKGGDQALINYVQRVKELGFLCGLYTNYVDFAPVNANWSPDLVARESDGNFVSAWTRCYTLKPSQAVRFEAEYAPRIRQKYGSNTVYCDVHTALPPWGRVDYDARVPEAAMFRSQHKAYSLLLANEKKAYQGPVFSEGNFQWFYAGLTDGNYGQFPDPKMYQVPPLVDFDLLRIHPLETDIGMGGPFMFYRDGINAEDRNSRSPKFDRFLASTIAYGHNGYLLDAEWGIPAMLKSYYMMQQLQERYALEQVEKIAYFDGQKWLNTSDAVRKDSYKRGQIKTRYVNGTETIVNLSETETLKAHFAGYNLVLPANGYAAAGKDFFEVSGICNGHKADLVFSPAYLYADGRGQMLQSEKISLKNSAAILRDEDKVWLIPIDETEKVSFLLKSMQLPKKVTVLGCDENGTSINKKVTYKIEDNWLAVTLDQSFFKYLIKPVK